MKSVIVFGFVTAYSIGMSFLLNVGIAWTDAPILFPLSLTALFLLIGWQVDRRGAVRGRRAQPRAPHDWRVPGSRQLPPQPITEALPRAGSRSRLAQGRLR